METAYMESIYIKVRNATLYYRVSIKSFPDYIYYKKTMWNTKGAHVEVY